MAKLFLSVVGVSLSVGLTVILLMTLTPFLNKRYAAKWKYLIWIFLALRLLVPYSGMNGPSVAGTPSQINMQAVPESERQSADAPTDITVSARRIIVEIPAQMTTPITVQTGKSDIGVSILELMAFIWMLGDLILVSTHLISYFHYKREVLKRGNRIEDVHILKQIFELKRELQLRRSIQAIEYCKAESPMIIGFFRPLLILPQEQYSPEELYFIVKHELVHLKRGDVYIKLLFVTANAVHWFNPLIWMMRKEANIDIELSCDERVTQGADYGVRKAYTETLLSMLHKRCARRTALSTQFYGGTRIMKKRFIHILTKHARKNGISILIGAVTVSIGLGTLMGYSLAKEDTGNGSGQSELTELPTEPMPVDSSSSDRNLLGDMSSEMSLENVDTIVFSKILTFYKEGEQEQKLASLAIGDGYSLFFPDDAEWRLAGPDLWVTPRHEQVALWVTHFEGSSMQSVNRNLTADGYEAIQDGYLWKQVEDTLYYVKLKQFDNDLWGVFYSYPTDCEEGWGRELLVIADTFAPSVGDADINEYLGAADCQEIREIVDEFARAYFDGNIDAIKKYLVSNYGEEPDIYESTGTISDYTVKGLSDASARKIKDGKYTVSLEFRDSSYEDMLLYLTIILTRQDSSWKIQFYGVEG